jgi:hypothetical protein
MARSGSYDYTVTAADIVKAALEDIDVAKAGEDVDSDDSVVALRTLNLMVKQWMGKGDIAPGLKVWTRKRGYIFPDAASEKYDLGSSGDHATLSYGATTIDAAEASGQTVISVAATSQMTVGDYIGIVQDDGTIHWSTISSISAGDTVTIALATTAAASVGNRVYNYTTKVIRPLSILTMNARDLRNNEDVPMHKMEDIWEYDAIPNKFDDVFPTKWWYEAQLDNGVLYLDGYADSSVIDNYIFPFTFLAPVDDLDATTDNFDYPAECMAALEWGLAKRLAPKFNKAWTQDRQDNYVEALMTAQMVDPETRPQHFQPFLDGNP